MTKLLELREIVVQGEGRTLLEAPSLVVEEGELLAVIGPNGAGKSTLLKLIARLIRPQRGQIWFRGQVVDHRHDLAYRRRLGLVLQDPLLFDGSVFDNLAAGLRFRGLPRAEIEARVNDWLDRLSIGHLKRRPARLLSGGEAQRVALARALVLQPELLLLDEPFSALDSPTRARLLSELQALLRSTPTTAIFVTHDLSEALFLGSCVAVLLNGRIVQTGAPERVFSAPGDPQIAAFVGIETIIPGRVIESSEGMAAVQAQQLVLNALGSATPGQPVYLCLRPEDITLSLPGEAARSSARNHLPGRITQMFPQGPLVRVVLDCGFQVVALVTRASALELGLAEGKGVLATFKASAVHLIERG